MVKKRKTRKLFCWPRMIVQYTVIIQDPQCVLVNYIRQIYTYTVYIYSIGVCIELCVIQTTSLFLLCTGYRITTRGIWREFVRIKGIIDRSVHWAHCSEIFFFLAVQVHFFFFYLRHYRRCIIICIIFFKNVHCAGACLYPLRRFVLDSTSAKTLFNRPVPSIMVFTRLLYYVGTWRSSSIPRNDNATVFRQSVRLQKSRAQELCCIFGIPEILSATFKRAYYTGHSYAI